jgi:hypothetical protein
MILCRHSRGGIRGGGSWLAAEAPYASTLYRDFRSLGFTVATPMGVQRVFPSSQLIASRFYFRFGVLPCESRGSQVAHQTRCKRGQLLPRLLCGSTECLNALGGAPNASTPVFSPTVFYRGSCCLHVASSGLLKGACCKHLWVCRRSPLQRNKCSRHHSQLLGHSCCTTRWRYRRQYRQCS